MDNKNGYLFTGDLLYDETPVYAFFPTTNPIDLVESLDKISKIPDVTKIYGAHNTIGLHADILEEVKNAVRVLRENDLVKFGTGVHTFNGFSFNVGTRMGGDSCRMLLKIMGLSFLNLSA